MFITFEGGEGAGKTTLIEFLFQKLNEKKISVIKTREPGGDPFSEKLRVLLLESKEALVDRAELFLFLAARSQHVQKVIQPALKENKVVLCDRFTDSTIAYQGYARSLNLNILHSICDFAAYSLVPNLTFYIDVPIEIGFERRSNKNFDRMEIEPSAFHAKVRHAFLKLAQDHSRRIVVLDGRLPKEDVQAQALSLLLNLIV
jgi:dTMP kinase